MEEEIIGVNEEITVVTKKISAVEVQIEKAGTGKSQLKFIQNHK